MNEGWRNVSPENTTLWREDYFELKTVEKQQVQEGCLSLPFLPKARAKPPVKCAVPAPGGRNILVTRDESRGREKCVQTDLVKIATSFGLFLVFGRFPSVAFVQPALWFCHFFGSPLFYRAPVCVYQLVCASPLNVF